MMIDLLLRFYVTWASNKNSPIMLKEHFGHLGPAYPIPIICTNSYDISGPEVTPGFGQSLGVVNSLEEVLSRVPCFVQEEDSSEEKIHCKDGENSKDQSTNCNEEPKDIWNLGRTMGLSSINEGTCFKHYWRLLWIAEKVKRRNARVGQNRN